MEINFQLLQIQRIKVVWTIDGPRSLAITTKAWWPPVVAPKEIKVGTIDKFQGQEASVVIVSIGVSDVNDSARGLDFVFDIPLCQCS